MKPIHAAEQPTRPAMPHWSVDWLSVTLRDLGSDDYLGEHAKMVRDVVMAVMGLEYEGPDRTWLDAVPRHGYKRATQLRPYPVHIEWAGTPEQGTHLTMTGKACQVAAARSGGKWALDVWDRLGSLGEVTCSRVDMALDNEKLTPAFMLLAHARGAMLTRLNKPPLEFSRASGGLGTCYFGSRTSEAFVRCYDKAEQQAMGDDRVRKWLAPWYRLEYELKDERAARLLDTWRDKGWKHVAGMLDQVMSLRVPQEHDANRSRWPHQQEWVKLLGAVPVAPGRVPKPQDVVDLDRRLAAAAAQYGPLFAEVTDQRGHEWLVKWLAEATVEGSTGYQAKLVRQNRHAE